MLNTLKRFVYGTVPYAYSRLFDSKSDKIAYYKYLHANPYTHHPTYGFVDEYFREKATVHRDPQKGLPYVMHTNGKRLYFPEHYTDAKIIRNYRSLLIEQDTRYPHCYVQSLEELAGKTLLDVGSAEGFTSLDSIEHTEFVYLFEFEEKWIRALEATFEPWKDKVQIVRKYIGDTVSESCETLDNFFKEHTPQNVFIKMDIEGEERNALKGAKNLFERCSNLEFAVCTYHKKDDLEVISSLLDDYNCSYRPNKGYMYFKHHLRTCLLRGSKKAL